MFPALAILGRQPALGLAELESLAGATKVQPVGREAALLDVDLCAFNFNRLGGTIKLCKVLTVLDTTKWPEIEKFLVKVSPEHAARMPEGKMLLGLSVYDLGVSPRQLLASGLKIKKAITATGRPVRLIPNKEPALNSAQVLHNDLTGPNGWELIFVKHGRQTIVAQTMFIQNIEAYAARDQARPKRDAKVGMLPPKLAQIIINLAVNHHEVKSILDPFCGTGVLMQEAALMGYESHGADIDPRMGEFYRENMDWLLGRYPHISHASWQLADATTATWENSTFNAQKTDAQRTPMTIDAIASETYLGRPFSSEPSPAVLQEIMQDVNYIHKKFLQNLARQTKPGVRLCLALPAWKTRSGFKHLKVLDSLEELGYNRVEFEHARREDLIYYREGQFVGRELVTLIRK